MCYPGPWYQATEKRKQTPLCWPSGALCFLWEVFFKKPENSFIMYSLLLVLVAST